MCDGTVYANIMFINQFLFSASVHDVTTLLKLMFYGQYLVYLSRTTVLITMKLFKSMRDDGQSFEEVIKMESF